MTQANNDIQVIREEARSAKNDAASKNSRLKAAQQELDLLKERDAARRAEIRLQGLQDGDIGSTIQRASSESAGGMPVERGRGNDRGREFTKASRISPSPDAQSRNIENYFSRGPGADEYESSKSSLVAEERRVSMTALSSTLGGINGEPRKEKEKCAQTHPTSSSTPPRRPHYSLPSPAPVSSSVGAAMRPESSKGSHLQDRNTLSLGQTHYANRNNAHITTSGDRASSDSEVNEKNAYLKKRSPKRANVKSRERVEEASSRLRLPTPSAAAQYFSDSELQHYEKHSTSSSARMMKSSEASRTSRQQSQQQTVSTSYPPRPPLLSASDKFGDKNSLHFPYASSRKRNDDIALSYSKNSLRLDEFVSSSSSRNGRSTTSAMEPSKEGSRQSSMQDRAEFLYSISRENRSISETPAPAMVAANLIASDRSVPYDANAPKFRSVSVIGNGTNSASIQRRENDGLRSDRLQSMYERVTSAAAPVVWRDSDSSQSEDSDS